MNAYHVCETCAPAILNADTSGIHEDDLDTFLEFTENAGWLVDAGTVNKGGYWDCEACGHTQISNSAQAVETID